MTFRKIKEVDRQNKILIQKMGKIMKGDYSSSTKTEFFSSKKSFI